MLEHFKQIVIVGTGLLGGSVGLGLKAAGYGGQIIGVGRRMETAQRACDRGCVDEATIDLAAAVAKSDLVLVAVPLGSIASVFEQIAGHDHGGLIVTDVGSTKMDVIAQARQLLPSPQQFVGAHPMAGSEQQGPDAARADLCNGKPCIVCPEPDTDARALKTVESLWEMLGMVLIRMSADDHDRQTAVISHLPHAVAVLLVVAAAELGGWDLASTGFRDTTRLASSNPPMRADIIISNREQIINAISILEDRLQAFRHLLVTENYDGLLQLLEVSKRTRDDWLNQHHY